MTVSLTRLILPPDATSDALRLVTARGLRGFVDGLVSVLLASYLSDLGFSAAQIGVLITGTLLGSAALSLGVAVFGRSTSPRYILLATSALMLLTGLGFLGVTDFWPLLVVAIAGTMNPSGGDVSPFLPTEQALLTRTVSAANRTALFARYNLVALFAAACGALVSGVPVAVARQEGWDLLAAQRSGFVLYCVVAVGVAILYRGLSPALNPEVRGKSAPLAKSRRIVLRLAGLFCIDSFGGGFVVQSLLALWLFRRFGMSVETAGLIFFISGLLSAFSQLASVWLSHRIGLVRTMVFSHLPANVLLILAAFMPNVELAVACFLMRQALAQMDVPVRQSYVMAMVPPEERVAAATVTNLPRSLVSAFAPALGGYLLDHTTFGWPLVIGGLLKIAYDLLFLAEFQNQRPEEELTGAKAVVS